MSCSLRNIKSNLIFRSLDNYMGFTFFVKNHVFAKTMEIKQAEDMPWLALPRRNRNTGCSIKFRSVSSNNVHDYELPACASGKFICGSTSGFLIMVDETSEIVMIDPLAKVRYTLPAILSPLPSRRSIENEPIVSRLMHEYPVHVAVLSSRPDRNQFDYVLMVIHGEDRELAYYSALSRTWTDVREAGRYYDDIIFHKGKFYAADEYGKIIIIEPDSPSTVVEIATPWLLRGNKVYLVAIGGELFEVVRFLKENPNVGYETYKFEVHMVESRDKRMRMGNMEDWAFFLGQNESVAVSTNEFRGIKGNRIYFTDDNWEAYKCGVIGGHDLGVYDREEERSELLQCCQSDIQCAWPRPVWLMPVNKS